MSNVYQSDAQAAPLVSVIVPAYNSFGTIPGFLCALRRQTFTDFETIIVNSSPETQTGKLVAEGLPEAHFEQSPVRLLPHAARNRGVELAKGSLLVFTDPDCVAESGWLRALVEANQRGHRVVVGSMGLIGTSAFERAVHLCKFSSWLPGLPEGRAIIAPTAIPPSAAPASLPLLFELPQQ